MVVHGDEAHWLCQLHTHGLHLAPRQHPQLRLHISPNSTSTSLKHPPSMNARIPGRQHSPAKAGAYANNNMITTQC